MGQVTLGTNIASLTARRNLETSSSRLARVFERLSSGERINRASDDAAGLAIYTSLNKDTRLYTQAIRNANDAISAFSIADGTLGNLNDVVTRLKELATAASNGSYSLSQRLSLDKEGDQLVKEFNRIVASVKFNGLSLFDGSLSSLAVQLGLGGDGSVSLGLGDKLARKIGNGYAAETSLTTLSGSGIYDAQTADFNGDGILDLVYSDPTDGSVGIQLGNGDGSFQAGSFVTGASASAYYVGVGDFNNDGHLDIVTSEQGGSKTLKVSWGNGQGGFSAGPTQNLSLGLRTVAIGDINGDGNLDIVGSGGSSTLLTLYGNGSGSFTESSTTMSTGTIGDIKLGDLNGDGKLDLVAGFTVALKVNTYLNDGSGSFSLTSSKTVANVSKVALADFNYDGLLDVAATASTSNSAYVSLNQGGGVLGSFTSYTGLTGANGLQATDMDGDGIADLVVKGTSRVFVLKGHGDGTFDSASQYTATGSASMLRVGDFNNDGVNDLMTIGSPTTTLSIILANTTTSSTMARVNLTTQETARDALTSLTAVLNRIASERGSIGSSQSRLIAALGTLQSSRENYAAAASRIGSADIAFDSAELIREQILQQAGASVIGQANLQPSLALKLLNPS